MEIDRQTITSSENTLLKTKVYGRYTNMMVAK